MEKIVMIDSEETENFIKSNRVAIDMCKKAARKISIEYQENATKKAQSKIGKINSQDNISRKELQSAIGVLNINPESFYKRQLKILLSEIPNITDEVIETIMFES
ncbi:hypothetical protein FDA52_06810 [Clostridium botulinum]|nr:hypothetical protein [Clostridium botulinum]